MNEYVIKYKDKDNFESEYVVFAANRNAALDTFEDLAMNGDVFIRQIISIEKAE